MKRKESEPKPVLDDGFYRLYGLPVTLGELKEAGIRLYSVGPLSASPGSSSVELRLVFGTVTDEESSDPYWSVEVCSGEEGLWIACERNDDLNLARIRKLIESRVPPAWKQQGG